MQQTSFSFNFTLSPSARLFYYHFLSTIPFATTPSCQNSAVRISETPISSPVKSNSWTLQAWRALIMIHNTFILVYNLTKSCSSKAQTPRERELQFQHSICTLTAMPSGNHSKDDISKDRCCDWCSWITTEIKIYLSHLQRSILVVDCMFRCTKGKVSGLPNCKI